MEEFPMNISEALNKNNGQMIEKIANSTGLSQDDVQKVMAHVLPVVSSQMKNVAEKGKAEEIFSSLEDHSDTLDQYVQQPHQQDQQVQDNFRNVGEHYLKMIFGDQEGRQELAQKVSEKTQVSDTHIHKLLPFLMTAVMGAFNQHKQTTQKAMQEQGQAAEPNQQIDQLLGEFFNADKQGGSFVNDIIGLAKNLLGK
jgi:hypothetical protein